MLQQISQSEKSISGIEKIFLDRGVNYTIDEPYITVGDVPSESDWAFFISVVATEVKPTINTLLPLLLDRVIAFKVARNVEFASDILQGKCGYQAFAKIIVIYPKEKIDINAFSIEIKMLLQNFNGPNIPTAASLGNNLYVNYTGAVPFKANLWAFDVPIPKPAKEYKRIMFGKYLILDELKGDFKGSVYRGKFLNKFFFPKQCVIKEGKKHMWSDSSARDIRDRLQWQAQLQKELQGIVKVPKVIDLITYNDDKYLIMEFIEGESFDKIIKRLYKETKWLDLSSSSQLLILDYIVSILTVVKKLHMNAYVHRDVKPHNFIINKKREIVLIDLELSCALSTNLPNPPFPKGTPGFASPQQLNRGKPMIEDDIYAVGGFLIYSLTGIAPSGLDFTDPEKLKNQLRHEIIDPAILDLIIKCYQREPADRPTTQQILITLKDFKNSLIATT